MIPRFPIGTRFIPNGKRGKVYRVVDILTTYNSAGEAVEIRYATEHEFCGQTIRGRDTETTIAIGLVGQVLPEVL